MTNKVFEQIMHIRDEGRYNMFNITGVQQEASELGYNELVVFLEEHKDEYTEFILTGQR